jgi:CDP-diacylglycerol--glycerol-3-phosphate 3-phosphatidyltransferase
MDHPAQKERMTFEDRMRLVFKDIIGQITTFLMRSGIKPNNITTLGLLGNIGAAILIGYGHITIGGLLALFAGACDSLDGSLARARGEVTEWGAFVDSITDRYSEMVLLFGLQIYFMTQQNWIAMLLVYLAAAGSVMVSYVKARAEGLGYQAKVGILTRFERYLVLVPCLIFNIPVIGIWVIAIFANFTALQRIYYVRRQVKMTANKN